MNLLDLIQINELLANKGKTTSVLLWANSVPRIGTYLPIAHSMQKAGYLTLFILPSNVDTLYFKKKKLNVCFVNNSEIKKIRNVDIFICSETCIDLSPVDAIRVAIYHSLPDRKLYKDYSSIVGLKKWLGCSADYLTIPIIQKKEHWKVKLYKEKINGFFPAEMLAARRKDMTIIPLGHPKIEAVQNAVNKVSEIDRVVFCPTRTSNLVSVVEAYGTEILTLLLRLLPNHRIVFRPYPPDDHDKMKHIAEHFADNDRFTYDLSVTGEDHMLRSAFVVTDASSAAVTFSLSTKRPSIFFRPDRKHESRDFDPIGVYAHTIDELQTAAHNFANQPHCYTEKIASRRGDFIYNPGTAITYLVESIPYMMENRMREGWLPIPRTPWIGKTEEDKVNLLGYLWKKSNNGNHPHHTKTYNIVKQFFDDNYMIS